MNICCSCGRDFEKPGFSNAPFCEDCEGRQSLDKVLTEFSYSTEILDLVDSADSFTRSDLQGIVSALVGKIIKETTERTQRSI